MADRSSEGAGGRWDATGEPRVDAALSPREVAVVVAFWAFLAALSASVRLLDPRVEVRPEVTSGLITLAVAEYAMWALLTLPIVWLAGRYSIEGGRRLERVLLFVALGIAIAILVDAALVQLRQEVMPGPRRRFGGRFPLPRRGPGPRANPLGFLDDLMVYFAVLGGGVARDYFLRYRARQAETARLEAEAAQLRAQLAEARLAVLRTQLDPHFLFNTLNAVSALVERDPRGVRRMIARLSELLRHTLEEAPRQEVTLEEELEVLRRYLEIMEIRFQGRLEVAMQVDEAVRAALVPHLILQPLVENALKHGVSRTEGTGRVEIAARREGEQLVLTVRDDGPGPLEPSENGVGLRNTTERLAQLYGARGRFSLRAAEGGGAIAEVTLPWHTDGGDADA